MIRDFMKKFGFIHESELTEEYLLLEVAKTIGDPADYEFDKSVEDELFKDLAKVHNFTNYLTSAMAKDMQRDFASSKEQSPIVHGAYARTAYIKSRLLATKEKATITKAKMTGLRYE